MVTHVYIEHLQTDYIQTFTRFEKIWRTSLLIQSPISDALILMMASCEDVGQNKATVDLFHDSLKQTKYLQN